MKLRQFELLCMLKKYSTISQVAQESFTSQPAVSTAIKNLESELGYPLLQRSNHGVQFTVEGMQVLEQAEIIMQAVDNIKNLSAADASGISGTLRIGSIPHICNSVLLNLQLELQEEFPDLRLKVESYFNSDELVRRLERNLLDFIIVQDCDYDHRLTNAKISDSRFQYMPLFKDSLSFTAPENHPLLRKPDVSAADLKDYPFAALQTAGLDYTRIRLGDVDYSGEIHSFNEPVHIRKFMQENNGFTILPLRAVIYSNMNYCIKLVPFSVSGVNWSTNAGCIYLYKDLGRTTRLFLNRLKCQCEDPRYTSLTTF